MPYIIKDKQIKQAYFDNEIESSLIYIIQKLNDLGIETLMCCEGHRLTRNQRNDEQEIGWGINSWISMRVNEKTKKFIEEAKIHNIRYELNIGGEYDVAFVISNVYSDSEIEELKKNGNHSNNYYTMMLRLKFIERLESAIISYTKKEDIEDRCINDMFEDSSNFMRRIEYVGRQD